MTAEVEQVGDKDREKCLRFGRVLRTDSAGINEVEHKEDLWTKKIKTQRRMVPATETKI